MTETKTHNAKEILTEALDTIKATFWIANKEFLFAEGTTVIGDDGYFAGYTWEEWNEVNKAILVGLDTEFWSEESSDHKKLANPEAGKAKVTGVCSIGALALANVTLYDEPLAPWEAISARDPQSWLAGAALANEIIKHDAALPDGGEEGFDPDNPPVYWLEESGEHGSIIAAWNDRAGRTREQIIEMFAKALSSPLLTATEVYAIEYPCSYNSTGKALVPAVLFATEQDAQEFLDSESKLRNHIIQYFGDLESAFTVAKVETKVLV